MEELQGKQVHLGTATGRSHKSSPVPGSTTVPAQQCLAFCKTTKAVADAPPLYPEDEGFSSSRSHSCRESPENEQTPK